jgi:lipid II isoglutaminyl synthase (glutamine-hydrolysing)
MKPLKIVHLYPSEMNIYGDTGNRIVLEKRLAWRGIPFTTILVHPGDDIPKDSDIVLGGGGQDASQSKVAADLFAKKDTLQSLVDGGCVMLMICGMYQLFGNRFVTSEGEVIDGLGLIDVETRAGAGRLIGNIVTNSDIAGQLVGYENHSGRTYLGEEVEPLAKVVSGVGNDDESGLEGCRYKNVFATYMHGPILSKNPVFADLILSLALSRKGMDTDLSQLDDSLEMIAAKNSSSRPR